MSHLTLDVERTAPRSQLRCRHIAAAVVSRHPFPLYTASPAQSLEEQGDGIRSKRLTSGRKEDRIFPSGHRVPAKPRKVRTVFRQVLMERFKAIARYRDLLPLVPLSMHN
jgi:hypothetical protein